MIKTETSPIIIKADSHRGMTGKQNEDRYAVSSFQLSEEDPTPSVLAVLCDGIGGHRAGEVAAEIGVTTVMQLVAESDGITPLETLDAAFQAANAKIYQESLKDRGRQGMGCTIASAWIIEDQLFTASIGDTRIYLLREKKLIQLTTDHTWIQEALQAGLITAEEAINHPNVHVIRRYLGSPQPPEIDFRLRLKSGETDESALNRQGMTLLPDDVLLLCSDGLSDLVTDDEIKRVLATQQPENAVTHLIDLANKRGGHDNITIILLQVPPEKPVIKKRTRLVVGCLLVLLVISLVFSGVLLALRQWGGDQNDVENLMPIKTPMEKNFTPLFNTQVTEADEMPVAVTPTLTASTGEIENSPTPMHTITPWHTNTLPAGQQTP